jgi:hypothetical protein
MSSPAGAARYAEHSTGDRPVYARVLRLGHLNPGGVQCFVLFEGMIAVGFLLALAELVPWWGVLALPAVVAAMVKINDVIAAITRPDGAPPSRSRAAREPAAGLPGSRAMTADDHRERADGGAARSRRHAVLELLARLLGRRRGPRRPVAGATGTGRAGAGSSGKGSSGKGRAGAGSSGTGRAGAGPGGAGAAGTPRAGTGSGGPEGVGSTGAVGTRTGSAGTDPSEPGPNMRKAITRPRGRRGAIYGSPTGRLPAARSGEAPPPDGPAIGRATIPSRVGPGEAVLNRGRDASAEPPADDENTTQGLTHSLNVLPAIETVDSPRQRARQSGARRYDD